MEEWKWREWILTCSEWTEINPELLEWEACPHSVLILSSHSSSSPGQGFHGELWGAPVAAGGDVILPGPALLTAPAWPPSHLAASAQEHPEQGAASCHRDWPELGRFGFNPQLQHALTAFLCCFLHLQLVSSSLPLSAFYDFGNWSGVAFSPSFTFYLSKGGECIPQMWCVGSAVSLWTGTLPFPGHLCFTPLDIQGHGRAFSPWSGFLNELNAALVKAWPWLTAHIILGSTFDQAESPGSCTGSSPRSPILLLTVLGMESQREQQMQLVTTCLGLETWEPPDRGLPEFHKPSAGLLGPLWTPCFLGM